jgi:bile acid:Na+ symporter, BASS family
MRTLTRLLGNRNLIMLLGLAAGLVWSKGAEWVEPLTLPALALVMTVATVGIDVHDLRSVRAIAVPAGIGIFMNYVVLSSIIILLSRLVISDTHLATGFILVAAVPPAVAVVPFTYLLKGDRGLSLMGTLGGYIAALIIMPVMVMSFLGAGFVTPNKLLVVMGELVLLPLIAGHILNRAGFDRRLEPYKGPITNWGFSLVTYVIVGLNREVFLYRPLSLIPTAIIVVATTFVLGWVIEVIVVRFTKVSPEAVVSLILMGTLKNYGVAGGLALTLFNRETASPSTVSAVFMIVYIIWLEWRLRRRKRRFLDTN